MADDEDAYGQVPEQYDTDITPEAIELGVVSLDEPWEPPGDRKTPPTWPNWLPPGALALAAAAIGLVALLGNGIGSSFGYVLKYSLSSTSGSTTAPAHTALNVQLVLAGLAVVLGALAVMGLRATPDAPRWCRDLAIAAIIVGIVAAGVHWTLLQSLDNHKIPPDVVFNSN
ncbi:MAG: hypothetical protein QOI76_2438 [Frankiales bacterium]|jgi:hypothetical protein|nr:hypothetical protein [Frankiales bacterium]